MWSMLLVSLTMGADPSANNVWPGFRGDGTNLTTAKDLPLKWSPTEAKAWQTTLPGYGQSSPVVWKDRIFLTAVEGEEKQTCIVCAVDSNTGKIVWKKEFPASQKGRNNPMMSRAASTPVVDANGLYVFFESGDLFGLSHTGDVKWQRSLSKEYGELKNNHGLGSSLTQTEEAVILLIDHAGPSYLLAVNKSTGKDVWKQDRASRSSWTSPIVTTQKGRPIVLVSSSGSLTAYDAVKGSQLWNIDGLTGNNIASPTVFEDMVIVGAGENRMKPDAVASAKSNCCIRLVGNGDQFQYESVWQGKKAISHHASPVIHQGHVYILNRVGLLYCLDLKTGEEKYSERLDNPCWATPLAAGEYLYCFGKDGITTVIKAGSTFEKVASNRLWSEEEFKARKEKAKQDSANQAPKRPEGGEAKKDGPPAIPKEQREQMMYDAIGDIVYGVAAIDGAFFIRTGNELICVRKASK